MKTILLLLVATLLACTASAQTTADTLRVTHPESVSIITDGERLVIDIKGKAGNPDYNYHNESALNGGSFVRVGESKDWDFSLPEFQNLNAVVWQKPVADWTSAHAWFFIDRVELTDTATTVYVSHQVVPQYRYCFGNDMKEIYLADKDGRRYFLHSLEGTTLGEWHHKDYYDTEHYRFHFDPMPRDAKWFNFITEEDAHGNCYNYFYVHDESATIAHDAPDPSWQHLKYDDKEEPLGTAKFKAGVAQLNVQFLNYQHSMFDDDNVRYELAELDVKKDGSSASVHGNNVTQGTKKLDARHSITIATRIDRPAVIVFSMGNIQPGGICLLVPGETTECLVNMLAEDNGNEFLCEFRGPYALTNKQLTTYGIPLEIRRHLKQRDDFSRQILQLTPTAQMMPNIMP